MHLVFMGTPEFAVPSLKKLAASSHSVIGVVTAPDGKQGRGLKRFGSPVKEAATLLHLPILQPQNLEDSVFLNQLQNWNADCFVVAGFRILPEIVFEMPKQGCFNLHASLLPKYRGPAPIQWAIIQGERETGVTTFFLKRRVDTGDIILQKKIKISDHDNSGDLHKRLALLGADLVLQTVERIAEGNVVSFPQTGKTSAAPKITPEVCEINWYQSAIHIHDLIRGLAPRPGAFSFWENKRLKIFQSEVVMNKEIPVQSPGSVVKAKNEDLWIQTGEHLLAIKCCQIEGKSRMMCDSFLRGYSIQTGHHLSADNTQES